MMKVEKMLHEKVNEVRQKIGDKAFRLFYDWMAGAPINAPIELLEPILLDPERTREKLRFAVDQVFQKTGVYVVSEEKDHDGKTQFAKMMEWKLREKGLKTVYFESILYSIDKLHKLLEWAFAQENADVVFLDDFPTYKDDAEKANRVITDYAKKCGKTVIVIADRRAQPFIDAEFLVNVDVWWEYHETMVNVAALAMVANELDDSYVPALAVFIHDIKDVFHRAIVARQSLSRIVSTAAMLMNAVCDTLKHS